MAYLNNLNPFIEAIRTGKYAGKTCYDYSAFGRNSDVDTGAAEDVWNTGGVFTAPTTARIHDIVSTNINDDGSPAGTGARTITVYGVTSNGLESETVTMNGTTNVATSKSYYDIYRMVVATAGSGLTNAGTITATAQTDATVTCSISVGAYQSSMKAIRFIPSGYTGFVFDWYSLMYSATVGATANVALFTKYSGGVWIGESTHSLVAQGNTLTPGNNLETNNFVVPFEVAAENWIKVSATSVDTNNTIIESRLSILLVQD